MTRRLIGALMLVVAADRALAQDSIAVRDAPPAAQLAPGARVRVTVATGVRRSGRLVSVNDTVLIVKTSGLHPPFVPDARIDRRTVSLLEISATAKRRANATALGVVAGGVTGAVLGARSVRNPCTDPGNSWGPCFNRGHGALFGATIGVGLGVIVGRYVFGRDRWEPVSGTVLVPPPPA